MIPLTGDELTTLIKARDLLRAKLAADHPVQRAYGELLDLLHHSYLDMREGELE
jgi:hypothetical protein